MLLLAILVQVRGLITALIVLRNVINYTYYGNHYSQYAMIGDYHWIKI